MQKFMFIERERQREIEREGRRKKRPRQRRPNQTEGGWKGQERGHAYVQIFMSKCFVLLSPNHRSHFGHTSITIRLLGL